MAYLGDHLAGNASPTQVGSESAGTGIMLPGDFLVSRNGVFMLFQQEDNNLALYANTFGDQRYLWSTLSKAQSGPAYLAMQTDGNLVQYHGTPGKREGSYWDAFGGNPPGSDKGPYYLVVQDDGNAVIYKGTYDPSNPYLDPALSVWRTATQQAWVARPRTIWFPSGSITERRLEPTDDATYRFDVANFMPTELRDVRVAIIYDEGAFKAAGVTIKVEPGPSGHPELNLPEVPGHGSAQAEFEIVTKDATPANYSFTLVLVAADFDLNSGIVSAGGQGFDVVPD